MQEDRLIDCFAERHAEAIRPTRCHASAGFVWGNSWGVLVSMAPGFHVDQRLGADPELQVQNIE